MGTGQSNNKFIAMVAISAIIVVIIFPSGCLMENESKKSKVPDPPGTVITTINIGESIDFETGKVNNAFNFVGRDMRLESNLNFHTVRFINGTWEEESLQNIVHVGIVSGLGELVRDYKVPTSGWTSTTTALRNNGYFVKSENNTYGVFVESYLESTTGGVMGVIIKWVST